MSIVREFLTDDTEPVNLIMTTCTQELRKVYGPKPATKRVSKIQPNSSRIVAVSPKDTVVGVAECIHRELALYVQGIAVAPTYRRRGVATDLLAHCNSLAADAGLNVLEIATIKETGNAELFCRLGFFVIDERVSDHFWHHDKQPVTEVTLRRHVT
ncbi:GNAT family N-acetyltransferase [Methylobacter sp.]|uniref:GNAT family N-acetyltransferase n=1 Tax=Methylobacter sp. TaxID=2051955 RepID=UPI002FDF07CC